MDYPTYYDEDYEDEESDAILHTTGGDCPACVKI